MNASRWVFLVVGSLLVGVVLALGGYAIANYEPGYTPPEPAREPSVMESCVDAGYDPGTCETVRDELIRRAVNPPPAPAPLAPAPAPQEDWYDNYQQRQQERRQADAAERQADELEHINRCLAYDLCY